MRRFSPRINFNENNVKELRSTGRPIDIFHDTGCQGLAINITKLRQEPTYMVIVKYKGGMTTKNIGSVYRVSLEKARSIARNVLENKDEFLRTKFIKGEPLVDDFEKRGYLPRKGGELPLASAPVYNLELEYKKLKLCYERLKTNHLKTLDLLNKMSSWFNTYFEKIDQETKNILKM